MQHNAFQCTTERKQNTTIKDMLIQIDSAIRMVLKIYSRYGKEAYIFTLQAQVPYVNLENTYFNALKLSLTVLKCSCPKTGTQVA